MAACIDRRFILLAAPLIAGLAVFPAGAQVAPEPEVVSGLDQLADPAPDSVAEPLAEPLASSTTVGAVVPEGLVTHLASEVDEAEMKWRKRPVIAFADSPSDPNFIRQMELLGTLHSAFVLRDVMLITDTDPAARSPLRQRLRPRGFSLVMMDKDWLAPIRRPSPRPAREILGAIDRMPIARTEALERSPAGR